MAKEGSGAKLYLSQTKFPATSHVLLSHTLCLFSQILLLSPSCHLLQLPAQTHTFAQYPYVQIQSILQGRIQTLVLLLGNLSSSPQVILFPLLRSCRTKLGFIDLSMVFYLSYCSVELQGTWVCPCISISIQLS